MSATWQQELLRPGRRNRVIGGTIVVCLVYLARLHWTLGQSTMLWTNEEEPVDYQVLAVLPVTSSPDDEPAFATNPPDTKGPFLDWQDAADAHRALYEQQIQLDLGIPWSEEFTETMKLCQKRELPFTRHLPPPPFKCARYYTSESPVNIDCTLAKMVGPNPAKVTIEEARNGTRGFRRLHLIGFILLDGVLYYDKRTIHPRECVHDKKIGGFLTFVNQMILRLGKPPDLAFRFSCSDNPVDDAVWCYDGVKDQSFRALVFPSDVATDKRWAKISNHELDPSFQQKFKHAEWRGARSGHAPMVHLGRPGFLKQEHYRQLAILHNTTSRDVFVGRYGVESDPRIFASYAKKPMLKLLQQNRILFSLPGTSAASNSLELMLSNSVVVMQDFASMAWQESFFDPGIHYIEIPRSLPHWAVMKVVTQVLDDRYLERYLNMSRLATTVGEIVAGDLTFAACYTSRALDLWRFMMTDINASLALDSNAVRLIDLTKYTMVDDHTRLQALLQAG